MKKVLITRPLEDAGELALALEQAGFKTFIEPMLHITPQPENRPVLDGALSQNPQLILATSRSAIRLLAGMTQRRDIPLLPVGESTAKFAASLGFSVPDAECETAEKLLDFVMKNYSGILVLYVRGEDITVDIEAALALKGFKVNSVILYRATPSEALSDNLVRELTLGHIAGVSFFSKRTAETYVRLVHAHQLESFHYSMRAVCISETVAEALKSISWQSVRIAKAPNLSETVNLIKKII